jgi:hypothetical protein
VISRDTKRCDLYKQRHQMIRDQVDMERVVCSQGCVLLEVFGQER